MISKGKRHCPGIGDLRGVRNPLGQHSTLLREWLHVVHGGYQKHHPFAHGGRETESDKYILAFTRQGEILTLFENSKILPITTKAPVWDPNRNRSIHVTNKFKNFLLNEVPQD